MLPAQARIYCKLLGGESCAGTVIGKVATALRRANQYDQAREFTYEATKAQTYGQMIRICLAYVEVY